MSECAYRVDDERRDGERRRGQRRDPRWRFDPLFAATLVKHLTPPERPLQQGYPAPGGRRNGMVVDLRL